MLNFIVTFSNRNVKCQMNHYDPFVLSIKTIKALNFTKYDPEALQN